APRFAHVPLVVACDGARLEKRTRGATVRELRDAGVASTAVIGVLAHGLGLRPPRPPPRRATSRRQPRERRSSGGKLRGRSLGAGDSPPQWASQASRIFGET